LLYLPLKRLLARGRPGKWLALADRHAATQPDPRDLQPINAPAAFLLARDRAQPGTAAVLRPRFPFALEFD